MGFAVSAGFRERVVAWPAHSVIIVNDLDVGETVEVDSALIVAADVGEDSTRNSCGPGW